MIASWCSSDFIGIRNDIGKRQYDYFLMRLPGDGMMSCYCLTSAIGFLRRAAPTIINAMKSTLPRQPP